MSGSWIVGWRNIAEYVGLKTRQGAWKWHRQYGMPVRRSPGEGRVVALREELDLWLINYDERAKSLAEHARHAAEAGALPETSKRSKNYREHLKKIRQLRKAKKK